MIPDAFHHECEGNNWRKSAGTVVGGERRSVIGCEVGENVSNFSTATKPHKLTGICRHIHKFETMSTNPKRRKTRSKVQTFHESKESIDYEASKEADSEGAEDCKSPGHDESSAIRLDDFDFEADEADTEELRALVASPTDGPVIVTVYYQLKSGRRQPIGFGMFNTKNIRQEILRFEASADAHFAPFYINPDILANRKVVLINWLFTMLQMGDSCTYKRELLL